MPAVILAGGLATRLHPVTETVPKALLDIHGKPFLWHQLQLLRRQGVGRAIVLAGYLGERIREVFGDGDALGVSLEYSWDGPTLLGTGGAIRNALALLPERFFVIYGDSYLLCRFADVESAFTAGGAAALMTVYRNEGRYDTSNVAFDGARILRYDKRSRTPDMHHIDYGLGAFGREVFESLPAGVTIDLADVYRDLLQRGRLAALEVHDRFYEVGSFEGLAETRRFLQS